MAAGSSSAKRFNVETLLRPSSPFSPSASSLFFKSFSFLRLPLSLSFSLRHHPTFEPCSRLYSLLTRFYLRHPVFWVKCEGAFDRKTLMITAQSRHFKYVGSGFIKRKGIFLNNLRENAHICIKSIRTLTL